MVNQSFCESLVRILKEDGEFLFKTDHPDYFEESMLTLKNFDLLKQVPWNTDDFYPVTDFEKIWTKEGKEIYSARFCVKK